MKLRNVFWGLLFLDVSFQVLHFGGMTFVDQFVHVVILTLASAVVIWQGRIRPCPRFIWLPIAVLFSAAVIQLIPMPETLVAVLNPKKAFLFERIATVFDISLSMHQITLLPWFHHVRLSAWVLDAWFFALIMLGPHISLKKFYYWAGGLSLLLGSILLLASSGKWDRGLDHVVGGPGNVNQTAGFLVFLMAIGMGVVAREFSRWRRSAPHQTFKGFPVLAAVGIGMAINVLAMFQQGSRSGFLLLIILVLSLPFWWFIQSERRGVALLGVGLVGMLGLVAILNIPSEKLTGKVERKGFYDKDRWQLNQIGKDELIPPAWFGQGLGASSALIGYQFPSGPNVNAELTEFHNDWLQILVEMGLPGLFFIGALGYWFFLIGSKANGVKSSGDRYFLYSIGLVFVLLGLQSLVTFPLRIIGIRLFMLVLLGLALRKVTSTKERLHHRWGVFLIVLVGLSSFWFLNRERIEFLGDPNPKIDRAARYGTVHHIPLFQAQEAMKVLIEPRPVVGHSTLWEDTRTLADYALKTKPTSLRAMNLIFQLDLMREPPNMDRQRFDAYKEKAEFIEQIGDPENQNAPLAKLLLFQSFPNLLNEVEKGEMLELQKKYSYSMRRAARKIFRK